VRYGQRLILLFTALSVLGATPGYAQTCAAGDLQRAIQRLQDDQGRGAAQVSLKQCGEPAVDLLIRALSDPQTATRLAATQTLGQMGWVATAASPFLVAVAQGDPDLDLRRGAVQALSQIARSGQAQAEQWQGWQVGEINHLKDLQQGLDQLLLALEQDQAPWPTKAQDLAALGLASRGLQPVVEDLTQTPTYGGVIWARGHLLWVVIGAGGIVVVMTYGAIFLCRPLLLLKLGDGAVQAIANLPKVGPALSGVLNVLLLFKYHPRVLDAWVKQHISPARKVLLQHPTLQRHDIHIAQPVFLGNSLKQVNFEPHEFADIFRGKCRLLIWGEGGAGKTSLACQFAYWALWGWQGKRGTDQDEGHLVRQLCPHRMIPVLIEEKLGGKTLLETIGAKLKELTGAAQISDDLLRKLLQERRVLVIVDHLSEITDEDTRQKIRPSQNQDYPVGALIVTSRDPGILGNEPITLLQPGRITTETLAKFLNQYLPEKQRREGVTVTFNPNDYADAYRDLGNMISLRQAAETQTDHQTGTTILLVKLYADQMLAEKQKREQLRAQLGEHYFTTQQNLADNVPDLMLNYLDALRLNNRDDAQAFPGGLTQPEEQTQKLHKIVQLVAWKCLEKHYTPEPASQEGVVQALVELECQAEQPEALALQDLDYLKDLTLIQFQRGDRTLRLSLDPLAEYLAALYKFWQYREHESAWMEFLGAIQHTVNLNGVRGFLLALYDCCDKKGRGKPLQLPETVLSKLVELTQLDQAKIDTYYRQRRMRLALEDLKERDLIYQSRGVVDLETIARQDPLLKPSAQRCLTEVLKDKQREGQLRQEVAAALGNLGFGAEELISLLSDPTEHAQLRCCAAETLGKLKAGQPELLNVLAAKDHPLSLRQGSARALSLIGAPSDEAVSMLVVTLPTGGEVKSIPVRREPLTDQLSLDLVEIPAGEFDMGSPEQEEGRNWYATAYPDTEGLNVEGQHRVSLPAFYLGQHPVTQAQWRAVAHLPAINYELNPDPAHFKGDHRPVEQVSWYEAVEFCHRLSRHTDKLYRLPSEAEWEYACRAGSTTPFYFGETITPELANYDGSYRYGPGQPGEYRAQTTPVGSFGVNPWGLADMHGNVYEWCEDHWHLSYDGAPRDGSAWVTGGDDRYRLVRGGSWFNYPVSCRSADRPRNLPNARNGSVGFRVVCAPPGLL